MQSTYDDQRKLYVGMHDRVCALSNTDAGKTWQQGPVTRLAHACWQPAEHQAQRHRNAPISRRMRPGCIAQMTVA